ncbi:hypothetical protein LTR62_001086 [Meristemomyces frigidus]|uniref:NmrA-like domain-containing protein n=1 Tax=Meristemomyces frigidus TaxID=1508187 RepID=A0AAN7YBS2_9PEZI|nr:hypothetical protein LTR62_001086 [Meristemomyces frigidus]
MSNLKNIAIVGAGGNIGRPIVSALLAGNKHILTALTRPDSTSTLPPRVHHTKKVDFTNHAALVPALQGQNILIITLAVTADPSVQKKLIDAAAEAGVRYILPNEYGINSADETMRHDVRTGSEAIRDRQYIEEKGMGWIGICCGFWYEFSLSGAEFRFGFDVEKKSLTVFGHGKQCITTSTWPFVGAAVAAVLGLPAEVAEAEGGKCLADFRNRQVTVASFRVSQMDMFHSVLRVTGTKESEWTLSHEDVKERFARGQAMMKEGNMVGFGIQLYARSFFPDGKGDLEAVLQNEMLGLPYGMEGLDEATRVAVEYAESGKAKAWTFGL